MSEWGRALLCAVGLACSLTAQPDPKIGPEPNLDPISGLPVGKVKYNIAKEKDTLLFALKNFAGVKTQAEYFSWMQDINQYVASDKDRNWRIEMLLSHNVGVRHDQDGEVTKEMAERAFQLLNTWGPEPKYNWPGFREVVREIAINRALRAAEEELQKKKRQAK